MSDLQKTVETESMGNVHRASRAKAGRWALGILLLALGGAAGWLLGQRNAEMPAEGNSSGDRRVLYWYDPMLPQHHFDKPGKSPFMDMELVPRYADEGATGSGIQTGIRIDPQVTQNLGLREARVERISLSSTVHASGVLGFNEREVAVEQVRSAGLVERVWPLAPGDVIAAGQPLIELRVPQWSAAQAEFLAVRGDTALAAGARERMRMLGLPPATIAELEQSGEARQTFILKSPRAGVLDTLELRSGMSVESGQTLARIQGIDTLWLEVAVPESHAAAVQLQGESRIKLAAYPGLDLSGRIVAILPELSPGGRTLRVRIELPNTSGQLRAGLTAHVQLTTDSGETALAVPTEAIIRTGKRSLVIGIREPEGFEPLPVELGAEIGERTVIVDGLAEGQRVVSSAQFLLDSEASLGGVFATSNDEAPTADPSLPAAVESAPTPHQHDAGHPTGEMP
jgi:Cu(I)/Ag(I) efflux system membrane fusion protein